MNDNNVTQLADALIDHPAVRSQLQLLVKQALFNSTLVVDSTALPTAVQSVLQQAAAQSPESEG